MNAQVIIDSGQIRELLLVVKRPKLPEWGVSQCFQIGDSIYYYTLTDAFYTWSRAHGEEFKYLDIDSQVVRRLNRIMDSLSDESWYDLEDFVRASSLHTGVSIIDSNVYGACREYVAKYVIVNTSSNCWQRGNVFKHLGNIKDRHVVLLHVDTSTVRECQLDGWILKNLIDKEEFLRTVIIRAEK